jgi:hypothetical protein
MAADDPLQGTGNAAPGAYDDWLQQARSRAQATDDAENSAPPPRPPSGRRRAGLYFLALLTVLVSFHLWEVRLTPLTTADLQGRLEDPLCRPLTGARVFLSSDPAVVTTTGPDGVFRLSQVPPGRRTLVIVLEDMGEEYRVRAQRVGPVDVGTLTYHVPPQRVRRASGGGAGWVMSPNDQEGYRN